MNKNGHYLSSTTKTTLEELQNPHANQWMNHNQVAINKHLIGEELLRTRGVIRENYVKEADWSEWHQLGFII